MHSIYLGRIGLCLIQPRFVRVPAEGPDDASWLS
ncbi:hypothetical protein ABIB53_000559 [Janibacter sp. UYMM211]